MFPYLIIWRTTFTFGNHAFPHVITLGLFFQTSAFSTSRGQPQINIFQNPLSNGTVPHFLSKYFSKTTLRCIYEWNSDYGSHAFMNKTPMLLNSIKPIDRQLLTDKEYSFQPHPWMHGSMRPAWGWLQMVFNWIRFLSITYHHFAFVGPDCGSKPLMGFKF